MVLCAAVAVLVANRALLGRDQRSSNPRRTPLRRCDLRRRIETIGRNKSALIVLRG